MGNSPFASNATHENNTMKEMKWDYKNKQYGEKTEEGQKKKITFPRERNPFVSLQRNYLFLSVFFPLAFSLFVSSLFPSYVLILSLSHTHTLRLAHFSTSAYLFVFPSLCTQPPPLGIVQRLTVIESFSTPGLEVCVCVCASVRWE